MQKKMAISKVMVDYDVLTEQTVTLGPALSSGVVQKFDSKTGQMLVTKVKPGDVIHTFCTEWVGDGQQRVKSRGVASSPVGWLSVQDENGTILLKARKAKKEPPAAEKAAEAAPSKGGWNPSCNAGDQVTWTLSDKDVPAGTIGIVGRGASGSDRVRVAFPGGTFDMRRSQLQLAAPHRAP